MLGTTHPLPIALSPRDTAAINRLKSSGLELVEVRITEFSPVVGQRLKSIPLPETSRHICMIRHQRPVTELDAVFVEEGDVIFLITQNEPAIREIFTVIQ